MLVHAVDQPQIPPLTMPAQFRLQVVYFMTSPDQPGVPPMGPNEYWIKHESAVKWLDELVVRLISPLDANSRAEVELTEDQERWLEWLVTNHIQHVRMEA